MRPLLLLLAAFLLGSCSRSGPPPAATPTEATPKVARWVCPMHPEVVRSEPGDCPICGMRLVPDPTAAPPAPGAPPPGPGSSIDVSPSGRLLAGIDVKPAEQGRLIRSVRVPASIVADERRVRRIDARVGGWVREVAIVGQSVATGEALLTLQSPEVGAAGAELQLVRRMADSAALVAAAEGRLRLLGVADAQIAAVPAEGPVGDSIPVASPLHGTVVERLVVPGQRVEAGDPLFVVADLATVRVEAAVPAGDARSVVPHQSAVLTFPDGSTQTLGASWIASAVDPVLRTLAVRWDVSNPEGRLRPGTWIDVDLAFDPVDAVLIADSAVLDTGRSQVAWVERSPGRFESRPLRLGLQDSGRVAVLAGIDAGELVAVRGAFLLDSEARLRGDLMPPHDHAP